MIWKKRKSVGFQEQKRGRIKAPTGEKNPKRHSEKNYKNKEELYSKKNETQSFRVIGKP